MDIDWKIIYDCVGLSISKKLLFSKLDLVNSKEKNILSFIDNQKYIRDCNNNNNVIGIFTTPILSKHFTRTKKAVIECDDPRFVFYSLYNTIAERSYIKTKTEIDCESSINKSAQISEFNVKIGKRVVIEANVVINPDVEIEDDCRICAGSILGADGYELKRTSKGIVSVSHDGILHIEKNVFIGCNTIIYKGFSYRHTIIGESTKIDSLVYIAHSVNIGKRCFVVGKSMICGSATVGNNVWIGPGSVISNGVIIEDNANISIGAVVIQNVKSNDKVSGNFAINHLKFIKFIKSIR